MEGTAAKSVIDEMATLKERTRADRRATSLPLLTFGLLTLGSALLRLVADARGLEGLYWLVALPAGFAFVVVYSRRRAVASGVGNPPWPVWQWAAIGVVAMLLLPLLLIEFVGALALTGAALGVLAITQHNRTLALWAAAFVVVGILHPLSVLENRLFDLAQAVGLFSATDGYFSQAPAVILAMFGAAVTGAGLLARRRERQAA